MDLVNNDMRDLGPKIKCKGMDHINMLVDQSIMDNGKITSIMAKEFINFQMVQYMKVNGKIIKCMELVILLM